MRADGGRGGTGSGRGRLAVSGGLWMGLRAPQTPNCTDHEQPRHMIKTPKLVLGLVVARHCDSGFGSVCFVVFVAVGGLLVFGTDAGL